MRCNILWIIAMSVALLASAGIASSAEPAGVVIRFLITREAERASAEMERTTYENAVLMAFGERVSAKFESFNLTLTTEDLGAAVGVTAGVQDNQFGGVSVGEGRIAVPVDGQALLKLPSKGGYSYSVILRATRRPLPERQPLRP